jgi:hypothetical protein
MDCHGSLAATAPRRRFNPLAAGLDRVSATALDSGDPGQTAAYVAIFTSASHESLVLIT